MPVALLLILCNANLEEIRALVGYFDIPSDNEP